MATTPDNPVPRPDIPPAIEPQVPPPPVPAPDLPDLTDDPPPETVNLSQEDEVEQAQTYADAASRGAQEPGLSDSEKPTTGESQDDVHDLVDHMQQMVSSGRIDMDAYRGERNDDDEEGSLGPAAARA